MLIWTEAVIQLRKKSPEGCRLWGLFYFGFSSENQATKNPQAVIALRVF